MLGAVSLVVPLFPLPDFVLFPGVTAGLHMFEPRYRALTADAVAGDGRFVIAGLRPGWQADYEDAPPIYEVASLCEMSHVVRLPDGRYNLLATGLRRVRVTEEVARDGRPYRRVEVSVMEDEPYEDRSVQRAFESLRAAVRCLIMVLGDKAQPLAQAVSTRQSCDRATFAVAALLARTPQTRQALLEDTDVVGRCEMLTLLASELLVAASGPVEGPLQ